jgi:hypothetical protein
LEGIQGKELGKRQGLRVPGSRIGFHGGIGSEINVDQILLGREPRARILLCPESVPGKKENTIMM